MTISFHYDFDSAALVNADITGDEVVLKPVPYMFNGQMTGNWFFFRIDGARGRTITFRFDTTDCRMHGFSAHNRCMMSHDLNSWQAINDVSGADNDYRFRVDIEHDQVWIAKSVPYQLQRMHQQIKRWLKSPYVSGTQSGNDQAQLLDPSLPNEQTWMSPGGKATSGRNLDPQPLFGLNIKDPNAPPHLPCAIILGGNHPGEHLANYCIDGLIDWWIADTPEAQYLRRMCTLLVYPMINPDGRLGGYVRGGPTFPHGDHNRLWGPEDQGQQANIDRIKQAVHDDVSDCSAEFLLDFHNQEKTSDRYMNVNTIMQYQSDGTLLPILARMLNDLPNFRINSIETMIIEPGNTTCKTWGAASPDGPRAKFSYTLEPGSPPEDQIAISREYGKTLALGVYDHFHALLHDGNTEIHSYRNQATKITHPYDLNRTK